MSAVEHSAEKITEAPNLAPSAIRLDIVVHFIRVLHNFMPVFTLMFSIATILTVFKVVQKTIDSILPVMVSSLKNAHSARLDLYFTSRDFLRVFTDASITYRVTVARGLSPAILVPSYTHYVTAAIVRDSPTRVPPSPSTDIGYTS
ncbi:hypothetical protein B0H14DRAFT_3502879 [Mycena olivaceomarginata]|nr:hypothetical protein B0H14DRAFT_3502879 [Mycena olivaceomarginata]